MSALITEAIPEQGFEKVRDKIAIILLTELEKQKEIQEFEEEIDIYQERMVPMAEEEALYFNILLDSGQYESFTATDVQGRTRYFIDIYTTGEKTAEKTGSMNSAARLHKFMGMVRYILSSAQYKRLGFDPGFIGGSYIESFATADPDRMGDSSFTRFARIAFSVRILEANSAWEGVQLLGTDATVKLEETDKGYKYVFSEP